MARVKRSVHGKKKRREVLAQASGYRGLKKNTYRKAKEQMMKSLSYAYRDRRVREAERVLVEAEGIVGAESQ